MSGAQPSAVLHVTFSEPAYSVSIEGMHAIFAPFGRLVRIVLFTKKGETRTSTISSKSHMI